MEAKLTALDVLKASRAKLEVCELRKFSFAGDSEGRVISVMDTNAVSFCTLGLIFHVSNEDFDYQRNTKVSEYIQAVIGENSIQSWNDQPERTKEDVLEALDKAIALAEQDEME